MQHLGRATRALWAVIAGLLVASTAGALAHVPAASDAAGPRAAAAAPLGLGGFEAALDVTDLSTTTTTLPPTTTTTRPPPPTTAPPPPTTAPKPAPKAAASGLSYARLTPPAVPAGLAPYVGLGTWSDVYDWSASYTNGQPGTGPADVDAMAARGVQTLYIQASKHDAPGDLVDPDLLMPILRRAKEKGIRVVAWYLPTLVDPQRDMERMLAIAKLQEVDSLAVDIEARNVSDVNDRNARLVQLSKALRDALPGRTIGAIVLPPVVLEVVNPNYWPNFPYRQIAPYYDVWQTMGYWTNRKADSGYRDAYRYTKENVDRLRANLGRADLPVHPIGGIGDKTTPNDVDGFRRAAIDTKSIGGSVYDWRTTRSDCWPGLGGFRA